MIASHYEERRRQLAEDRFGGICACGDHAWCRLTKGFVALVDAADAHTIKTQAFHVALSRRGGVPYAAHGAKGDEGRRRTALLEHELLGDPPEGKETNFRNGNSLDYRRSNLEWGDHGLTRHRIPRSTKQLVVASSYKGVSRSNRHCITGGRWWAKIKHDGKQHYLGSFPLTAEGEIAAARAYDDAARKLYGEFAAVNFPRSGEWSVAA